MQIETVPNENVRIYHLHRLVTDQYIGSLYKMIMDGVDYHTRTDIHDFLKDALDVEGVEEIYIGAYKISVTRGRAYTWGEIEYHLLPILEDFEMGLYEAIFLLTRRDQENLLSSLANPKLNDALKHAFGQLV